MTSAVSLRKRGDVMLALLPISLLFFIGFRQLFPARFSRFVLPLYFTLFVLFDSAALFGRLIPFIYG